MSETDVREIVKKFNECLNRFSLEKIDLERKLLGIENAIDDKKGIIRTLYKDKEKLMMDTEELSIGLE